MLNQQSILDVTKLMTGKDGQLFVTQKDGTQLFLAEVDTFTAQLSQNNVDYPPSKSFPSVCIRESKFPIAIITVALPSPSLLIFVLLIFFQPSSSSP